MERRISTASSFARITWTRRTSIPSSRSFTLIPFQYFTPKRFASTGASRARAGHSYVVVLIDGMGTNGRSKAFRDVAYTNLNDAGFPDRIKWMQAAASTRPWMDISRVGITGGSAGGQNAAAAVSAPPRLLQGGRCALGLARQPHERLQVGRDVYELAGRRELRDATRIA
ncbi:dipeptidyl-peptidase IV [Beauveria brongniartii RCEF 3172]|uniref:Dipeptidyl-peptidase IV n=1 Tax=Beauveria brongniartii RCEF 3172 TaxID=1081107 RepID=A0A167ATC6_9HYPO|nr:dipeptidyl-peptidase IV [Beauveria brongniartii RCEF 3172]